MTDLQNTLNPTNNFEAENSTPAPENNTGIDLSSTLEPNPATPSMGEATPSMGEAAPSMGEVIPSVTTQTNSEPSTESNIRTDFPNDTMVNQNNQENIQNANSTNREKFIQLLKSEWLKGKKAGFTKGILSGVALTLCIVIASAILAKDQVIDFLSSDKLDFLNLNANVVSLTDNNQTTNDNNENSLTEGISQDESNAEEETTSDESNAEEETTSDESNVEEETTSDESNVEEETTSDESNVEEETTSDEKVDEIGDGYTLKYVNSPEEANWVLSPSCDDVFCKKDKESIVWCNEFRLYESLSNDAPRVGNSGVCRYKDPSELVYIKLK